MTTLMIADDHPIILSGAEALLRNTSYEVIAKLKSGNEVLGALEETRPDILVLDVNMPDGSGIDVLRALRQRDDRLPVILLTAGIDDRGVIEAVQLGLDGLVLKDTAADSLLHCLDEVKAGRRWIDQSLLQRALDRALGGPDADNPLAALSQRERAVAALVVRGLRNREIASELDITEGTVKIHLHKVYEKLGVSSRTELVIHAKDML